MAEPTTCPTCWLPTRPRAAACPICRAPLAEVPVVGPRRRRELEPARDAVGFPLMLVIAGAVVVALAFFGLMLFGVAVAVIGKP